MRLTNSPGVTVQLGEHYAGDIQGFVKGLCGVYRILADHGVHHQKDLIGVYRGLHDLELFHQLLVHMQAACSIQKHQVVSVLFCVFDGGLGDVDRITLPHLKDGNA